MLRAGKPSVAGGGAEVEPACTEAWCSSRKREVG